MEFEQLPERSNYKEQKDKKELKSDSIYSITSFEDILPNSATHINLHGCQITSFNGISHHNLVESVDVSNTLIRNFKGAADLSNLTYLNIDSTPLMILPYPRETAVFAFGPQLTNFGSIIIDEDQNNALFDHPLALDIQKRVRDGGCLIRLPNHSDTNVNEIVVDGKQFITAEKNIKWMEKEDILLNHPEKIPKMEKTQNKYTSKSLIELLNNTKIGISASSIIGLHHLSQKRCEQKPNTILKHMKESSSDEFATRIADLQAEKAFLINELNELKNEQIKIAEQQSAILLEKSNLVNEVNELKNKNMLLSEHMSMSISETQNQNISLSSANLELQKENEELSEKITTLKSSLEAELSILQNENNTLHSDIEVFKATINEAENKHNTEVSTYQAENNDLKLEIENLSKSIESLKAKFNEEKDQLQETNSRLNEQLQHIHEEMVSERSQLADLKNANQQLSKKVSELSGEVDKKSSTNKELEEENNKLRENNEDLSVKYKDLETEKNNLILKKDLLENQLNEAKSQMSFISNKTNDEVLQQSAKFAELESKYSKLSITNDSNENEIRTLKQNIEQLQEELNVWKSKTIKFIDIYQKTSVHSPRKRVTLDELTPDP